MMYFYTGPTIKKDIIGKNQDVKEVTNNSEQELLEVAQEKNQENINNQREVKDNSVNLDKQKLEDDFIYINEKNSTHVLNAISPAFTASFELADKIIENSFM